MKLPAILRRGERSAPAAPPSAFIEWFVASMPRGGSTSAVVSAISSHGGTPELDALLLIDSIKVVLHPRSFRRMALCLLGEGEYTEQQLNYRREFIEAVQNYLTTEKRIPDQLTIDEKRHLGEPMYSPLSKLSEELKCGKFGRPQFMIPSSNSQPPLEVLRERQSSFKGFAIMCALEDVKFILETSMEPAKRRWGRKGHFPLPMPREALEGRRHEEVESLRRLCKLLTERDDEGSWKHRYTLEPMFHQLTWDVLYNLAALTDEYNLEWALAAMEWGE